MDPFCQNVISKNFLESIVKFPVVDYEVKIGSKPGDNYMSSLYKIEVQTDENNNSPPEHLFFKTYPTQDEYVSFLTKTNFFYKEVSFYTILVPKYKSFVREILGKDSFELPFPTVLAGKSVNWWETQFGK